MYNKHVIQNVLSHIPFAAMCFMMSSATAFSKLSRLEFCLSRGGVDEDNCMTQTVQLAELTWLGWADTDGKRFGRRNIFTQLCEQQQRWVFPPVTFATSWQGSEDESAPDPDELQL